MTSTSLVWVRRSNTSWVAGEVASIDGDNRRVRLVSGEYLVFGKDAADCLARNAPGLDSNSNLVLLENLDEPNLLHAISLRYAQQQIYTRTGHILCAVNPWNAMSIYDKPQIASYRKAAEAGQLSTLNPHIFETAALAHISVCKGRHESILVSGDSGAGKTESTKLLIRYLASCGQGESGAHSLVEEQVVHSNPLLESLGNAKTVRNDNSSRFGKFVSIFFDSQGRIASSSIQTYDTSFAQCLFVTSCAGTCLKPPVCLTLLRTSATSTFCIRCALRTTNLFSRTFSWALPKILRFCAPAAACLCKT
jgi:myosin V